MSAPASRDLLRSMDEITLDFDKLEAIIAVCRVAAIAAAGEGEAQAALRDDDLPEALYAARELASSLKARVERIGKFALAAGAGCVPDAIEARQ